jgi:Holliday junction resolvase-like predicted endonuclease
VILVTVDTLKACENRDIKQIKVKKMTTKQQLIQQRYEITCQKSRIKKKTSAQYVALHERWHELTRRIDAIQLK